MDVQIAAYKLSEKQAEMIALHDSGASLSVISKKVFGGKATRQGVQQKLRSARLKIFRYEARTRYASAAAVPIKECPIPARTRQALILEGYKLLGQLRGKTDEEIGEIEGVGPGGAVQTAELLHRWGLGKAAVRNKIFCPNCGEASNKPSGKKFARTCKKCGTSFQATKAA